MENKNENNEFRYTYSASEQVELKRIREKYTVSEESKMNRIRRLDRSVYKKAQTASLILGVVGILILGFGMSLCMSEFSGILGEYIYLAMPVGVLIGAVGMILTILAYPVYNHVLARERKKLAPEIIKLTDELMK